MAIWALNKKKTKVKIPLVKKEDMSKIHKRILYISWSTQQVSEEYYKR